MEKNSVLEMRGICKYFPGVRALEQVDFTLREGEIHALMGENGAGKTTTIRAVTGLSSYSGTVSLFGSSTASGLLAGRRRMGCLVEKPILYPDKDAYYNLRMQQMLYGVCDLSSVSRVLARVGLNDVGRKKVRDFSLGMRQRLGIAMALVNSPSLLILDEPVNGLDPMGMVEVRELLRSLCFEDGITIVVSSHILAELYQLVTDYIFISHGRIIETISKVELDSKSESLEQYYMDLLGRKVYGISC